MLDHFTNKGSKEIQGKSRGMIIVKTRKLCVQYFKEINNFILSDVFIFICLCFDSSYEIDKLLSSVLKTYLLELSKIFLSDVLA